MDGYVSKAQQGLFHSPHSPVAKKDVKAIDHRDKGNRHLPEHVKPHRPGHYHKKPIMKHSNTVLCMYF